MVDRRQATGRSSIRRLPPPRRPQPADSDSDDDKEKEWRLRDRWLFDGDDCPTVGPEGQDEQDRVLVDDYEPRYIQAYSDDDVYLLAFTGSCGRP
jgi:enhancer of polycomb-like protein